MDQQDVITALASGEAIGMAGTCVDRVDTHLSHVFLTEDRAYKLKRAVKLPFVDFSTADRRRAACETELEVNQRFAPRLYLGVQPVMRTGEGVRVGGEGDIVDWVVELRRFRDEDQFDRLAQRGRLTLPLIRETAAIVVDMHEKAEIVATAGHAADYRHIIRELRETEADGARRMGVEPAHTDLFDDLDTELTRLDHLIESRRRAGKVRRGHGDLHLRNICLFEGRPTPFDALEFDPRLATIDILYDLAFLLMDLRFNDLPAHANAVMNAYWDASGEGEEALDLLPFFMALRATVRMSVAVEAERLAEADAYRALAIDLLKRPEAALVAVGGLSGSGKSAVAAELCPLLPGPAGARWLRSDVIRKQTLGIAPQQHAGDADYTDAARTQVYRELAARAGQALHAHACVVADATFLSMNARTLTSAAAPRCPLHAFWLDAPLEVRLERIAGRSGDPSDADASVAAAQEDPVDLGADWRRIDALPPAAETAANLARLVRGI